MSHTTYRYDFKMQSTEAEEFSEILLEQGAHSILLENAQGEDILEPKPGETPIWEYVWVCGYFNEAIEENILKLLAIQYVPDFDVKHDFKCEMLEEEDWLNKWQEYLQPMAFGKRQNLWIIANNLNIPPEAEHQTILHLNPGLAFGTGNHETTALCLDWLADHIENQDILIDYGCGSGILALAALKLGVEKIIGVDYDPQALYASQENFKLNNISLERAEWLLPNAFQNTLADILVANILAEPLCNLVQVFKNCVKQNGYLVLSGILQNQIKDLLNAYKEYFIFEEPVIKNNWVRLVGRRK